MNTQKKISLILYILLSVMSLAITVLLLIPYTRTTLINVLFSFVILIYVLLFLSKGVMKEKNIPVVVINVVEIVLVSMLIISQYIPPISITEDLKQTLGILFWLRGTSSILTSFFNHKPNKYRMAITSIDIILITLGTVLIASTSFSIKLSILAYILAIFTVITLAYGIFRIVKILQRQKSL